MLKAKGLLHSRPKVGTRVEPRARWNLLDRDVLAWYMATPERARFLKSVQEMRRIFEPEAAALAAVHRDAAQMAAISVACRDMGTATTLESRIEADVRFHLGILSAAGNEFLVPFGFLIESALANVFDYVTRSVGTLRHAQSLHENIEKAIRHRRPEAARRAARLLSPTPTTSSSTCRRRAGTPSTQSGRGTRRRRPAIGSDLSHRQLIAGSCAKGRTVVCECPRESGEILREKAHECQRRRDCPGVRIRMGSAQGRLQRLRERRCRPLRVPLHGMANDIVDAISKSALVTPARRRGGCEECRRGTLCGRRAQGQRSGRTIPARPRRRGCPR